MPGRDDDRRDDDWRERTRTQRDEDPKRTRDYEDEKREREDRNNR